MDYYHFWTCTCSFLGLFAFRHKINSQARVLLLLFSFFSKYKKSECSASFQRHTPPVSVLLFLDAYMLRPDTHMTCEVWVEISRRSLLPGFQFLVPLGVQIEGEIFYPDHPPIFLLFSYLLLPPVVPYFLDFQHFENGLWFQLIFSFAFVFTFYNCARNFIHSILSLNPITFISNYSLRKWSFPPMGLGPSFAFSYA